MDVKILAICDTEKLYARKLMEAFSRKETSIFQIHAFSTEEELAAFAERTQVEILLISGSMMSRSIDSLKIGKIILLSDGDISEEFPDYETIYKYQSAEHIMKEILCCYADYAKPAAGRYAENKEFAVYGVYSPVDGCGRTCLSEALAGYWGKTKKTLFLNLRTYSFLPEQRNRDDVWDLSDMIYFLRQGKRRFCISWTALSGRLTDLTLFCR